MSNNIENLPSTRRDVLLFLHSYIEARGFPPTLREIAAGCYISLGTVVHHLNFLEVRGWIERTPGRSRSIRVLRPVPAGDRTPLSEN